jgi:hypothetical protein
VVQELLVLNWAKKMNFLYVNESIMLEGFSLPTENSKMLWYVAGT